MVSSCTHMIRHHSNTHTHTLMHSHTFTPSCTHTHSHPHALAHSSSHTTHTHTHALHAHTHSLMRTHPSANTYARTHARTQQVLEQQLLDTDRAKAAEVSSEVLQKRGLAFKLVGAQQQAAELAKKAAVSDMALQVEVERRLGVDQSLSNTKQLLHRCRAGWGGCRAGAGQESCCTGAGQGRAGAGQVECREAVAQVQGRAGQVQGRELLQRCRAGQGCVCVWVGGGAKVCVSCTVTNQPVPRC